MLENTILLYSKSSCYTGKELARCLGIRYTGKIYKCRNFANVICWGCKVRQGEEHFLSDKFIVNDYKAIRKNRNKFLSMKILKEASVSIPKFCEKTNLRSEIENGNINYPIIGRSTFHQGGSNFKVCLNLLDIDIAERKNCGDYFVEMIPILDEYRLHVFGDKIIRISKKTPEGSFNSWKRNYKSGWVFKWIPIKTDLYKGLRRESKKAVSSLGLVFGAVDIIVSEDKQVYVIEVNTAPRLEENGLGAYRKQIELYVKENWR